MEYKKAGTHLRSFNVHILTFVWILILVILDRIAAALDLNALKPPEQCGAASVDIVHDPADVPAPVRNRNPGGVQVTLKTEEIVGTLDAAAGTTYRYWTFNGKVPGPMIRVRQGDTVEVTLRNNPSSHMVEAA